MASFSIEEFIGNGILKELLPKLLEEGWDDVPTLKIMNVEDMDATNMTREQKDALEIRTYLHDRSLMQYGDKLELSGKCLPELLSLSSADLSSQFGMKRGHIARFMDRSGPCTDSSPQTKALPPTRMASRPSTNNSTYKSFVQANSQNLRSITRPMARNSSKSLEQSLASFKIGEGYTFKGIVAAGPGESRACGCVKPPPVVDQVAPYSAIENISLQKLTPEYKIGMERLVKSKAPPMKASELWRDKPAVILCIRRPGLDKKHDSSVKACLEMDKIWIGDFEEKVKDFWPRYWGGVVLYDRGLDFFKALGGGELLKEKFLSGFVFNLRAIANYRRAKAMGIKQNLKGEGEIKGGLFIMGSGRSGIAYQFIERNFGDWAPPAEFIEICKR
ncbi:hypothetical protein L484_026508 [Morus notabilis]|uniref:Peroxiredoxin-like 2A n=1 Tax=Morus notabilis TaxID=981085 RepID=W9QNT6_9ROSA|nr:hypothetical protein L484_026508 [Morus notabilis]